MATALRTETADFAKAATLDELHRLLKSMTMTPGWAKRDPSLYPEPKKNFRPYQWKWSVGKAALDGAGRLISTDLAERRNLILYNPIGDNEYATLRTLICAYQMILPGEEARSHRHTPNALRLILENEGATTIVQGERIKMFENDVLLTPNWHWHGHDSKADGPVYWLDGLDVPLVHMLEPMFLEHHPEGFERNATETRTSPMIFTWESTQARLDRAAPDPDGVYGRRIQLGEPAMPTIGLYMERFPTGTHTRKFRTTVNRVFCCVEGEGTSIIDGERFAWTRGDVVAAPAWRPVEHVVTRDATLFEICDEPIHAKLGFLRTRMD